MSNNKNRLMPFLMAICLVAGILIGTFYTNHFPATNWVLSIHLPIS